MTIGIIEVLLTSATISAIVGGLMSWWFQEKSYRNDYYKTIISKRLEAYENVSSIVMQLKITVVDNDNKPYHIGLHESPNQLYKTLMSMCLAAMSNIWLSEEMIEELTKLNKVTYLISNNNNSDNGVSIAKDYYEEVGQLRTDIENCIKQDMKDLYDVKKFLKKETTCKHISFPLKRSSNN